MLIQIKYRKKVSLLACSIHMHNFFIWPFNLAGKMKEQWNPSKLLFSSQYIIVCIDTCIGNDWSQKQLLQFFVKVMIYIFVRYNVISKQQNKNVLYNFFCSIMMIQPPQESIFIWGGRSGARKDFFTVWKVTINKQNWLPPIPYFLQEFLFETGK